MWGSVSFDLIGGVCPFGPAILWDTIRMLYLHEGVCHILHRTWEKFADIIKIWTHLNLVDAF